MALLFEDFVRERHSIWMKRQLGSPQPWTEDPILARRKFTNVFRILDPGTQYVLRNFNASSPADALMLCFLYRHTGRTEAWDYLLAEMGTPTVEDLETVREVFKEYRGSGKTTLKNTKPYAERANRAGGFQTTYERSVFTGAYLVFPQSQVRGTDKLDSIIDLTQRLFPAIVPDFLRAETQAKRFAVLRRNKGVADFMSYQILTDWGYLDHHGRDTENEFVVPGPGSVRGYKALAPDRDPVDTIHWALSVLADVQLPTGRSVTLVDCQNLGCEFSKYVRELGKPQKSSYTPAHPGPQTSPLYPTHWK